MNKKGKIALITLAGAGVIFGGTYAGIVLTQNQEVSKSNQEVKTFKLDKEWTKTLKELKAKQKHPIIEPMTQKQNEKILSLLKLIFKGYDFKNKTIRTRDMWNTTNSYIQFNHNQELSKAWERTKGTSQYTHKTGNTYKVLIPRTQQWANDFIQELKRNLKLNYSNYSILENSNLSQEDN